MKFRAILETSKLRLAELYEKGEEVPQDYPAAAKIYRELADLGPRQSRFYGAAQFNLCQLYATGRGVPQDLTEARSRCKEAANHEIRFAHVALGRMAEKGLGQPVDLKEAAEYYQQAASEGVTDGFMELGRLKLQSGTKDDTKEAYFWFYLAQTYKIARADSQLQRAAEQLSPKDIQSAETAANEWRHEPFSLRIKKIKIR